MAYCEGDGLGALPMPAKGYMRTGPMASPLDSPALRMALARKQAADAAAAAKKAESAPPPPVSPTGAVPPPPIQPDPFEAYVPPMHRTEPEIFRPAAVPVMPEPGGGVGPISVTVAPGLVAPEAPAAAPRGFGMVEAAIAAGIAAILGMAMARKGRRR